MWSSKGTRNPVVRMPAGPAVVITPWNAPFMLSTWKLAPALAAGNPVVLKPAEWSPLSCSLLADLAVEAGMPPGVFNLVQGIGEEVGPPLVSDPRVKRISFTGSPETARHIGRAAAENIVPFTAELGGKGPLIVFADADLDAAAAKAAGQYDDSGQVCLAGTRLLVEASIRDEFLARFDAYVDRHVLGDSRDPATTIAPMIHPDHVARVLGLRRAGPRARRPIVRGGHRVGEALHVEPTLIEPASNDSEVVQHEVFGPVLTLQTFTDEAQAVELANSTPTGCRRSSSRRRRSGPSASAGPCAAASCGSTRSSSATSRRRSAASASPASAARAATTPSTSTATSRPCRSSRAPRPTHPSVRCIGVFAAGGPHGEHSDAA